MKNVKLKIKNEGIEEAAEDEESPIKSGANDGCATPGLGVDAVALARESVLGEELEKGKKREKAHKMRGNDLPSRGRYGVTSLGPPPATASRGEGGVRVLAHFQVVENCSVAGWSGVAAAGTAALREGLGMTSKIPLLMMKNALVRLLRVKNTRIEELFLKQPRRKAGRLRRAYGTQATSASTREMRRGKDVCRRTRGEQKGVR